MFMHTMYVLKYQANLSCYVSPTVAAPALDPSHEVENTTSQNPRLLFVSVACTEPRLGEKSSQVLYGAAQTSTYSALYETVRASAASSLATATAGSVTDGELVINRAYR